MPRAKSTFTSHVSSKLIMPCIRIDAAVYARADREVSAPQPMNMGDSTAKRRPLVASVAMFAGRMSHRPHTAPTGTEAGMGLGRTTATYLQRGAERGMSAGRRKVVEKDLAARRERAVVDSRNKLSYDFNTHTSRQGRFDHHSAPNLAAFRTDAFETERSIYLPTVHPRTQLPGSAFD